MLHRTGMRRGGGVMTAISGGTAVGLACAALAITLMEERPLAGPSTPAEMAE